MAFIISKVSDIKKCKGNSDNLCMDLYDQWQYGKHWKMAIHATNTCGSRILEALKQHQKEGGVNGRFNKYQRNLQTLLKAMNKLGFTSLLSADIQSPIIVTFFTK